MFKKQLSKRSEEVKKSAAKVLDAKRDTPTRSKHLRIFLDNAEHPHETALFFENHYSHVFYIVYDAFVGAEINLRQKGVHKAQREELESVLYLLEKVLLYLPEHLGRKWQYHAMGRLMSKLLHPGNSWKLIKREAMRLFLLWYQILGDSAGDQLHAMFATLVPGFPSPYQGLGLTALAALTPDTTRDSGPINPAEICPLIPPQSGERWRSPETDLTRIFLDVLLELMVSQVGLIEWKDNVKEERQRQCFGFLFERFKMYYMPHIFPDFNWSMSIYRPALELPETRRFRPAFVDSGDGTKKMDPMLACRVVVIKWVAQHTHVVSARPAGASGASSAAGGSSLAAYPYAGGGGGTLTALAAASPMSEHEPDSSYGGMAAIAAANSTLNMSTGTLVAGDTSVGSGSSSVMAMMNQSNWSFDELGGVGFGGRNSDEEGNLVREILYANRNNVNFVHEVYRQAFLLSFNHSPAIKKVIAVYKDWIQMNVPELPPFLLEPLQSDRDREDFVHAMAATASVDHRVRLLLMHPDGADHPTCAGPSALSPSPVSPGGLGTIHREQQAVAVRAGLQNLLQVFVTNAANVFLLEVSPEFPILLEEQVEMCKRVLNIYRYMVMNVKMEARTWEQLLFILLQVTQLTLPEAPPRRREDILGGRLAQAIFQTLIVTWIKANLYVVVSTELWDQFLDVLSSLTLWEELVREWAKTMETLTRVLARQVYNLDLNDLPLDRLSERAQKKRRGKQGPQETKYSTSAVTSVAAATRPSSEDQHDTGRPPSNRHSTPMKAFQEASNHGDFSSGSVVVAASHSATTATTTTESDSMDTSSNNRVVEVGGERSVVVIGGGDGVVVQRPCPEDTSSSLLMTLRDGGRSRSHRKRYRHHSPGGDRNGGPGEPGGSLQKSSSERNLHQHLTNTGLDRGGSTEPALGSLLSKSLDSLLLLPPAARSLATPSNAGTDCCQRPIADLHHRSPAHSECSSSYDYSGYYGHNSGGGSHHHLRHHRHHHHQHQGGHHHHHQGGVGAGGSSSRSCSPAPSSGLEYYGCMKDSPIQHLAEQDALSEEGGCSLASDVIIGGDSSSASTASGPGPIPATVAAESSSSAMSLSSAATKTTTTTTRSVMSGGTVKGWLPDVAVVLWRRMLGSLGNINAIADPAIHAQIFKHLIELYDILAKIRDNQGVSLDNQSTPPMPDFVPPFTIFAPWCFRALGHHGEVDNDDDGFGGGDGLRRFDHHHHHHHNHHHLMAVPNGGGRGRNYALRLLCLLTCRVHDSPLPKTHLVQFYRVLHSGLTGGGGGGGGAGSDGRASAEAMNTLVRFTGPRFFSLMLPGFTAFILDFLYAANCIVSTAELKGVPRTEATSLVGALLAFPPAVRDLPLLVPNPKGLGELVSSADVKDQVIGVLLKSGKKEPAGLARCISLSSLGMFAYSELVHESFHPKIKEAIQVLLTALRFNNKAVAQIASDMLLLLADCVDNLLEYYPEVPRKIVEVLARTLIGLTSACGPRFFGAASRPQQQHLAEDEKRLLLSLLFCLGEWVMRVPKVFFASDSLMHHVFTALLVASGDPTDKLPPASLRAGGVKEVGDHQVGPDAYGAVRSEIAEKAAYHFLEATAAADTSGDQQHHHHHHHHFITHQDEVDYEDGNGDETLDADGRRCPVRLAARTLISHLVNHMFHFPMAVGAASLSSMVNEHDDNPMVASSSDELSADVFKAPNVQMFVVNDCALMSLVELPLRHDGAMASMTSSSSEGDDDEEYEEEEDDGHGGGHGDGSQVRIIFRDISGKFSWDVAPYGEARVDSPRPQPKQDWLRRCFRNAEEDLQSSSSSSSGPRGIGWEDPAPSSGGSSSKEAALRSRDVAILPTLENGADDLDNLHDLLGHIGHVSPEFLQEPGKALNAIPSSSNFLDSNVEKGAISGVLAQRNLETDHVRRQCRSVAVEEQPHGERANAAAAPPEGLAAGALAAAGSFLTARRLFSQLGYMSWENRPNVHLLQKGDQLLREVKHLDGKKCRETHKVAVIYVAEGQEDKQSILSNAGGSQAYEEFVAGLGWEVELDSHHGFMGGLTKSRTSSGDTSVYYATSFVEVMFHVSTRMPSDSEESMLSKTRHLGNDEIHIVWSEHGRDYRRGILPTEFCDVLLIIYPLQLAREAGANNSSSASSSSSGTTGLYRVQISRKPDVPYFGPLFNEAVVDGRVLPGLVRATAVNASRAKRSMLPHYQTHYEERSAALDSVISRHKCRSSYEEFVTRVCSPSPLQDLLADHVGCSSSSSLSSLSSHLAMPSYFHSKTTSNLLGSTTRPRSSTTTATAGQPPLRSTSSGGPSFSSGSTAGSSAPFSGKTQVANPSAAFGGETASSGIISDDSTSPRNLKKLTATFKASLNNNKKVLTSQASVSSSEPFNQSGGGNSSSAGYQAPSPTTGLLLNHRLKKI